ncbi:MAG: hypothetical protein ACLQDL_06380 [Spirochaetia bacterium]
MKSVLAVLAFLALSLPLPGQPEYLAQSDDLNFAGANAESTQLLAEMLPSAQTDQERAQIYWRLSRNTIMGTDIRRYAGETFDSLLPFYKRGESYADSAIARDPKNPMGYYLKACNIGRQVQAHATLSLVESMRTLLVTAAALDPQLSGPWYVLGQLYEQVPGWPFSFGNTAAAVSLGRKSLDAAASQVAAGVEREVPLDFTIQLARHLAKRNWSSEKRAREQAHEAWSFNAARDPVQKGLSYEGIVPILPISDRDEARELCRRVITDLRGVPGRTLDQEHDLANARKTLEDLGG